jgi:hypothetical protein
MNRDDDDTRRDRLRQQYPAWSTWYTVTSDVRTQWATRPAGSTTRPSFETYSFEEMELWLSTADPEAAQ